jgi:hypothetical protein
VIFFKKRLLNCQNTIFISKIPIQIKQVHVYTGSELENMKVCKGEDLCSATSVIPDFELTVNAVLFKQPKPV